MFKTTVKVLCTVHIINFCCKSALGKSPSVKNIRDISADSVGNVPLKIISRLMNRNGEMRTRSTFH